MLLYYALSSKVTTGFSFLLKLSHLIYDIESIRIVNYSKIIEISLNNEPGMLLYGTDLFGKQMINPTN